MTSALVMIQYELYIDILKETEIMMFALIAKIENQENREKDIEDINCSLERNREIQNISLVHFIAGWQPSFAEYLYKAKALLTLNMIKEGIENPFRKDR